MGNVCGDCGEPGELRPYGKGGTLICFGCMTGSPGTQEEAKRRFAGLHAAAGPVALVGGEEGPVPAAHLLDGKHTT